MWIRHYTNGIGRMIPSFFSAIFFFPLNGMSRFWRHTDGLTLGMAIGMRVPALSDNKALYPTYVGYIRHTHRCASPKISAWPSLVWTVNTFCKIIFFWNKCCQTKSCWLVWLMQREIRNNPWLANCNDVRSFYIQNGNWLNISKAIFSKS